MQLNCSQFWSWFSWSYVRYCSIFWYCTIKKERIESICLAMQYSAHGRGHTCTSEENFQLEQATTQYKSHYPSSRIICNCLQQSCTCNVTNNDTWAFMWNMVQMLPLYNLLLCTRFLSADEVSKTVPASMIYAHRTKRGKKKLRENSWLGRERKIRKT